MAAGQEARFLGAAAGAKNSRNWRSDGTGAARDSESSMYTSWPDRSLEKLEKIFGQWGTALYRKARGGDSYEFVLDAEPKSISHNHTFGEDTSDVTAMESMLSHLSQKACKRLREASLSAKTLTLTIRYTGFDTYTRAKTLSDAIQFDADAYAVFLALFRQHRNAQAQSSSAGRCVQRSDAGQRTTGPARSR